MTLTTGWRSISRDWLVIRRRERDKDPGIDPLTAAMWLRSQLKVQFCSQTRRRRLEVEEAGSWVIYAAARVFVRSSTSANRRRRFLMSRAYISAQGLTSEKFQVPLEPGDGVGGEGDIG